MKFLLIDDSVIIRSALKEILGKKYEGCEVVECEDGEEGIKTYDSSGKFDIIFVDIEMPKATGFDVVEHIRNIKEDSAALVIMITSRRDKKTVIKLVRAGVNDYIAKPFDEKRLLGKIEKALAKRAAEKKSVATAANQLPDDVIDDGYVAYVSLDDGGDDDDDAIEIAEGDIDD